MSLKSFRILLVAVRYFPYVGGVETHVYEVGRRLARYGIDVTVLTTDLSGKLRSEEYVDGMCILRVPAWPKTKDYYFAPRIYHIVGQGNWDLIDCVGYHTWVAPLAILAARRTRTPYIVTLQSGGHSSSVRNALRHVQWVLLRPLLKHANYLVAISKFEAEFFQQLWGFPKEHFEIIPNGSDLPKIEMPRPRSSGTLVVSVGRLERYKGHHHVLAAFPKFLEYCPDAELQIIGTGPFKEHLSRLAVKLGVADQVKITSIRGDDRRAMAELLSNAKLMTLLSQYESQAIAVMEALSLGCPVLVTATSALKELADEGYARYVPLNASADVIASAMYHQIRNPLVPKHIKLPTWDECTDRLLDVCSSVLGEARAFTHAH